MEPEDSRMPNKPRDSKIQGEGDYESARRYKRDVEEFVEQNDTEELAREAEPDSEAEARELERAEQVGRSRSKATKPER
jgi:hypothetical protein